LEGGTFTDFVVFNPNKETMESFKLLSTPQDPSRVVQEGLERHSNKRDDKLIPDLGKGSLELKAGDTLVIETPGGGGWRNPEL
jgi:N-methylhydantoinase A/oxoprolinase/acetone carboxylase beta subunit